MTNHRLQTSKDSPSLAKRKRVLAAVAEDTVTSEDDDNVGDGIDICNIIENHTLEHKQTATSNALHALAETIRNTLFEINEIREQNRDRRHKELLDILTKMVQHDSISKDEVHKTEVNNRIYNKEGEHLNNDHHKGNEHIIDANVLDKEPISDSYISENKSSTLTTINTCLAQNDFHSVINNQMVESSSSTDVDTTSNKCIKISPIRSVSAKTSIKTCQAVVDKPHVGTVKSIFGLKGDAKEELQKMRAQMLELQRKKMEDRERKKKELQQQMHKNK